MINVLLVDDDSEVRGRMRRLLTAGGDIHIVGEAASGRRALAMLEAMSPDVVLMDTEMPEMDGYETTAEIMIRKATPVIMIAPRAGDVQADGGVRAIQAGAVAALALPNGSAKQRARFESELVQTVRAMSGVAVIHRRRRPAPRTGKVTTGTQKDDVGSSPGTSADLIAIGASTGGPQALQTVLSALPRDFAAAAVLVQHITPEFQASFVTWLADATGLRVTLPENGAPLTYGTVYVAPQHRQMGVDRSLHITLLEAPPENGSLPSVSFLFRSLAQAAAQRTVAVLLTGMGKDGAAELFELRERGALTIAQSEDSSVVNGMPGEAIRLGAAKQVLSPSEIGAYLAHLTSRKSTVRTGDKLARR